MLALRSTCGLTDRTSAFLCLKGTGADPNLLISVMCLGPRTIGPLMLGGRGWLCQRSPRGTEELRKAELFGSLPLCGRPSYLSASFLLMEYNNARAPALLAFFTGARRMYHSSRS
uniref:Uncharacterized protein n=1 Tax=Nelumbo nucifera TaxID=4432 RepID=A0A822Y121_NELNU|nr:TPA_asm: hypothetical protein HUJ06_027043 [Nelumbo nucifera]DAD25668.1 TPA_asm: hypothetical protein HUJ06_027132 [Nelumbo nucifera]DAD25693.1 TPA_asm: hypothetical protein HUJ06_027157 [Nelumbo nucifera]